MRNEVELRYLDKFTKTIIENMESVQEVIKKSGSVIDAKLLSLIDEAEKEDFGAMAELYDMFAFGTNGVERNYDMALYYWSKLHRDNSKDGDPELISEGLNNLAFLHIDFDKMALARGSVLEAFTYMVKNLECHLWERQIIALFYNNMDSYIPEAEEE